ncbi:hypothetical protein HOK96_03495 [bacterium]|nr:hypothetical protein [bacterium]MBT4577782.1 hypothetical protein [bacterium]MBT5346081.1 hypothetical protein [bacterium]MBT6131350.1 hypothetical protein [bacterium]
MLISCSQTVATWNPFALLKKKIRAYKQQNSPPTLKRTTSFHFSSDNFNTDEDDNTLSTRNAIITPNTSTIVFVELSGLPAKPLSKYITTLNSLFTQFDGHLLKKQPFINKIKTGGSVLLLEIKQQYNDINENAHKKRALIVAKKLQRIVQNYNKMFGTRCITKIGIASGNVTGAYLYKKNRTYDVFGSVVNLAARMKTPKEDSTSTTYSSSSSDCLTEDIDSLDVTDDESLKENTNLISSPSISSISSIDDIGSYIRLPIDRYFQKLILEDKELIWTKKIIRPKGLESGIYIYESIQTLPPQKISYKHKIKNHALTTHKAVILSTDIKGFTAMTESHKGNSRLIINFLHYMFSKFDTVLEKFKGTKRIKTVGDAYQVEIRSKSCLVDAILIAQEFHKVIDRYNIQTIRNKRSKVKMRIGLAFGNVVGAKIGLLNPVYEVFGKTVNNAELMESSGTPGHTQINNDYLENLKKNKGIIFKRSLYDVLTKKHNIKIIDNPYHYFGNDASNRLLSSYKHTVTVKKPTRKAWF